MFHQVPSLISYMNTILDFMVSCHFNRVQRAHHRFLVYGQFYHCPTIILRSQIFIIRLRNRSRLMSSIYNSISGATTTCRCGYHGLQNKFWSCATLLILLIEFLLSSHSKTFARTSFSEISHFQWQQHFVFGLKWKEFPMLPWDNLQRYLSILVGNSFAYQNCRKDHLGNFPSHISYGCQFNGSNITTTEILTQGAFFVCSRRIWNAPLSVSLAYSVTRGAYDMRLL